MAFKLYFKLEFYIFKTSKTFAFLVKTLKQFKLICILLIYNQIQISILQDHYFELISKSF